MTRAAPSAAPVAAETVLELRDLVTEIRSVRGLVRPVDGVSLRVRAGEVVGLVGESGSGKSMTAFSVMRLFPTKAARLVSGEVRLRGRDLTPLRQEEMRTVRGREVGMIFQDPASYLNPVLTVGRQLEQQLQAHAMGRGAGVRIAELLQDMGLSPEFARRYPHELSGGQAQRAGIASALACRPALVIADEPTTALDVTIQAQVLRLMARLQREQGVAMLLITHDLGVVAEVCDHVYVMYAGHIVEEAPRYVAHGIHSDHTLMKPAKLRKGLWIMVQEKSLTPDVVVAVMALPDRSRVMLITDDVMPNRLTSGH